MECRFINKMMHRNKLDCSVSEEISNCIWKHLLNLKVEPNEAFVLSRKYLNINLALQNLSKPLEEYKKAYQIEEEKKQASIKKVPQQNLPKRLIENEKKEPEVTMLSQSKLDIYNKLLELQIDKAKAEFIVLNCDTLEEAMHNLGLSSKFIPEKKIMKNSGTYTYSCKEESTEKCSICLEFYQNGNLVKNLPCLHKFHEQCINLWLQSKKKKCPECLTEIKYEFN